jgi:hypothetical protein
MQPPSKTMLAKIKMGIWKTSAGNHSVFSDGCSVSVMALEVAWRLKSSATRPTAGLDCNQGAMAGLDAALQRPGLGHDIVIHSNPIILIWLWPPSRCWCWLVRIPIMVTA